jgi:sigma-B regulation protein RsbU (phosphoserine phosphatase)
MLPAKFVAGDFYDFVTTEDKKLGLLIGDVSGKGVSASLIMAQTISFFRIFARQCRDCANTLNLMNRELYERTSARFVTCMYIIIDTASNGVCVSSAGHSPLLFYKRKTNEITEIEVNAGMPLGVAEEVEYANVSFDMGKGDKIIIFTDGLSEARNSAGQEFGMERIKRVICENYAKTAAQLSESIVTSVRDFSLHCTQRDDLTLIIAGR